MNIQPYKSELPSHALSKYPGGKMYDEDGTERPPQQWADPDKRAAALVVKAAWQRVLDDAEYQRLKRRHIGV